MHRRTQKTIPIPNSLTIHTPVLLQEVLMGLNLNRGDTVLDATLGGGGHAFEICERIGDAGTLIGLDADISAVERAARRLRTMRTRKFFRVANFRGLEDVLAALEIKTLNAALFDLGLSSFQLEESGRGFSFERDEPLLMTFSATPSSITRTAGEIIAYASERDLAKIFSENGERWARRIARMIVREREKGAIENARNLGELVRRAVPANARHRRTHPATQVFQALRIAVNDEVNALEEGLATAWRSLSRGGRLAVISFHSGEDRIVKRFGKEKLKEEGAFIHTRKPITPTEDERRENPRSRSAKLRIFEKR